MKVAKIMKIKKILTGAASTIGAAGLVGSFASVQNTHQLTENEVASSQAESKNYVIDISGNEESTIMGNKHSWTSPHVVVGDDYAGKIVFAQHDIGIRDALSNKFYSTDSNTSEQIIETKSPSLPDTKSNLADTMHFEDNTLNLHRNNKFEFNVNWAVFGDVHTDKIIGQDQDSISTTYLNNEKIENILTNGYGIDLTQNNAFIKNIDYDIVVDFKGSRGNYPWYSFGFQVSVVLKSIELNVVPSPHDGKTYTINTNIESSEKQNYWTSNQENPNQLAYSVDTWASSKTTLPGNVRAENKISGQKIGTQEEFSRNRTTYTTEMFTSNFDENEIPININSKDVHFTTGVNWALNSQKYHSDVPTDVYGIGGNTDYFDIVIPTSDIKLQMMEDKYIDWTNKDIILKNIKYEVKSTLDWTTSVFWLTYNLFNQIVITSFDIEIVSHTV